MSLTSELSMVVGIGLLQACTPSQTEQPARRGVGVPSGEESGPASAMGFGEESGGSTEDSAATTPGAAGAAPPPGDCEDCYVCSDTPEYEEEDGTEHSCCRFVGPMDCSDELGGDEAFCHMKERCDPRCCESSPNEPK